MVEKTITATIQNKKGLHARAAAKFVKTVERFPAEVTVCKQDADNAEFSTVGGLSILGLMMLAADTGSQLLITAKGDQADEVLAELESLLNRKFDEGE